MRTVGGETIRNGTFTLAVGLTLLGLFAPWVRSGSSTRSSFELLDLVERLGFASGGAFDWGVRLWPFAPLAMVSSVVAVWLARARIAAVLGAVCGVYVLAIGVALINAPDSGLIRVEWGVSVSLAGGIVLLCAACWVGVSRRSA